VAAAAARDFAFRRTHRLIVHRSRGNGDVLGKFFYVG
jgi:hypothetical protein